MLLFISFLTDSFFFFPKYKKKVSNTLSGKILMSNCLISHPRFYSKRVISTLVAIISAWFFSAYNYIWHKIFGLHLKTVLINSLHKQTAWCKRAILLSTQAFFLNSTQAPSVIFLFCPIDPGHFDDKEKQAILRHSMTELKIDDRVELILLFLDLTLIRSKLELQQIHLKNKLSYLPWDL